MLNVIQIGGQTIAVGLQWSTLPGETSERKEAGERARENGLQFGVIFNAPNSTLIGLHDGDFKNDLVSGAVLLAERSGREEAFILIEPISDTKSWFCAIRGGAPLQGFDIIIDTSNVSAKIEEAESLSGVFKTYSPGGQIDGTEDGDFLTLTQADVAGVGDTPRIIRLQGVNKKFYYILAGATLLAVCAWGGKVFFENQAKAKAAAEAQRQEALAHLETENAKKLSEKDGMAKLDAELLEKIGDLPTYGNAVVSWLNAIGGAPNVIAAWKLQDIICKADSCIANYRRFKLGTVDEFVAAVQEQGFKLGEAKLNSGSIVFSVPKESRKLDKALLPDKSFQNHFTSQLQRLEQSGLAFMVVDPEEKKLTIPPAGNLPEQKFSSGWMLGEFNVSGKSFFEARDTIEYLDFINVSATSLKIDFAQFSWSIGGYYAVK